MIKKIKNYTPAFAWVFALLGIIAAAVQITAICSSDFANFWSDNISSVLRAFTAHLTSFFPFSVAETIVISSPIILVCVIVYAVRALDLRVRYDLNCYSVFFDKYRESKAADVSDAVNNGYLKSQVTVEGSRSYGMVVDLAVAYYRPTFTDTENAE